MDTIFSLIAFVFIIDLIYLRLTLTKKLFGIGKAATKAAQEARKEGGDFNEKFKEKFKDGVRLELNGMQPMEIRGVAGSPPDEIDIHPIEIEVRGLFPNITERRRGAFVLSVFDVTDVDSAGNTIFRPVVSSFDKFQENDSNCYLFHQPVGSIKSNYGFTKWVKIGVVIPEFLQPPRKGERKLRVVARLVDEDDMPEIENGFISTEEYKNKVIWEKTHSFTWLFSNAGWIEEIENNRRALCLVVQLAVAVANSDGQFHDDEGEEISKWMRKKVSLAPESNRSILKDELNAAFKEAFVKSKQNTLSCSELTSELLKCDSETMNIECLDLIYTIISADGVAASNELLMAKQIADALNIDSSELKLIADKALVSVAIVAERDSELEDALGIDQSLSAAEIRKYLREEFQKWNNRLNSLNEGKERDSIQYRLNLIAKARDKYKE
jgi:hypothetical protein